MQTLTHSIIVPASIEFNDQLRAAETDATNAESGDLVVNLCGAHYCNPSNAKRLHSNWFEQAQQIVLLRYVIT